MRGVMGGSSRILPRPSLKNGGYEVKETAIRQPTTAYYLLRQKSWKSKMKIVSKSHRKSSGLSPNVSIVSTNDSMGDHFGGQKLIVDIRLPRHFQNELFILKKKKEMGEKRTGNSMGVRKNEGFFDFLLLKRPAKRWSLIQIGWAKRCVEIHCRLSLTLVDPMGWGTRSWGNSCSKSVQKVANQSNDWRA